MRSFSIALGLVVASVGALWAADGEPGRSAQVGELEPNVQKVDLEVEFPIKSGFEGVPFRASVPGFELIHAKLDADQTKTRAMIGLHFTSRTVETAHVVVELLDKDRKVLYRTLHTELLGPEKVVQEGHNLTVVSRWGDTRAIWLNFPYKAREAELIRIQVELERQ